MGWNVCDWIVGTALPPFLYSAMAWRAEVLIISRRASSWASPDIVQIDQWKLETGGRVGKVDGSPQVMVESAFKSHADKLSEDAA